MRIEDFFKDKPIPKELPNKEQWALLTVLGQMDQSQHIDEEVVSQWSKRGHKKRNQIKEALKNRKFNYLFEFHKKNSNGIKVAFPYMLWISGISKRKVDVVLYHSYVLMRAIQMGITFIDMQFLFDNAFKYGKWSRAQEEEIWKLQKQDGVNLLEDEKAWVELHNNK